MPRLIKCELDLKKSIDPTQKLHPLPSPSLSHSVVLDPAVLSARPPSAPLLSHPVASIPPSPRSSRSSSLSLLPKNKFVRSEHCQTGWGTNCIVHICAIDYLLSLDLSRSKGSTHTNSPPKPLLQLWGSNIVMLPSELGF